MLSVVIPARHEGDCVWTTVKSFHSALFAAGIKHQFVLERDDGEPHGYGLCVRRALNKCHGDVIAVCMSDGSDSPSDLVDYFRIVEQGYDCAFGTRWYKGHRPADYPWPKYVLNRLANNAIMLLFGHGIGNDCTNAFKMYRREVIEAIQPLESEQFDLTVEMPLKAYLKGFKIAHPPISWQNRKTGKSKWKISELGSKYIRRVLQLWWRSRF